MILNEKELIKKNACKNAIEFLKRNNLLDKEIKKIEGDYEGWYEWYKQNVPVECMYDTKGNVIKEIFPNGVYEYEYDENGNITKKIFPNGVYECEYDEKGNITKEIYPDGDVYTYEYEYDEKKKIFHIKENKEIIAKIFLI